MSYRQQVWSAAVAAALGLSMQPAAWAQDKVIQTVEPGRCSREVESVVATIDAMMFRERPNINGYTEALREKLPKGPCDIEAIRAAAKSSPHFRWHKILRTSETFRFVSKDLVADFWVDLKTKEMPNLGIQIHAKKTEADYQ